MTRQTISRRRGDDHGLTCAPRFATRRRPERLTLGPAVAEASRLLGRELMPWQRYVADVAGEVDPVTGRLVYRDITLVVGRQAGKTTLVEAQMLQRCMAIPFFGRRQKVVYAAQTRLLAREKWEDEHVADLDAAPQMKDRYRVRRANGQERIRFSNGSTWGLTATTDKAGHGPSLDLGMADEFWAQVDDRLDEAWNGAMSRRWSPQRWNTSSAGDRTSLPLRRRLLQGRTHVELDLAEDVAYFEWSAPDDADPSDPRVWSAAIPSYDLDENVRISVAADFKSLPAATFRRQYLSQWVEDVDDEPVFGVEPWKRCGDPASEIDGTDGLVLAADVSPDRSTASVCVAGRREDGRWHGEVIAQRSGASWVNPRLEQLMARWSPRALVVARNGQANNDPAELERICRAHRVELLTPNGPQVAAACSLMWDSVIGDRFRFPSPMPELDAAARAAQQKQTGELMVWARKKAAGDITALYGVSLGLWGVKASRGRVDPTAGFH